MIRNSPTKRWCDNFGNTGAHSFPLYSFDFLPTKCVNKNDDRWFSIRYSVICWFMCIITMKCVFLIRGTCMDIHLTTRRKHLSQTPRKKTRQPNTKYIKKWQNTVRVPFWLNWRATPEFLQTRSSNIEVVCFVRVWRNQ